MPPLAPDDFLSKLPLMVKLSTRMLVLDKLGRVEMRPWDLVVFQFPVSGFRKSITDSLDSPFNITLDLRITPSSSKYFPFGMKIVPPPTDERLSTI